MGRGNLARNKTIKMQGIKNIVFDFGGVLTGLDKDACVKALYNIGAGNIACYVDECRQEDLFHDLEIGKSTVGDFCNEVRRLCPGCNASNEDICGAWNTLLTGIPRRRLEKLLSLRQEYRLMLLSNTNPIHWHKAVLDFFPYEGHEVDDYFEKTFLSYRMHMVKPDCEVYQHVLLSARILPGETLFIDDSPINCAAASELGITSLCVKDGDEWMDKL